MHNTWKESGCCGRMDKNGDAFFLRGLLYLLHNGEIFNEHGFLRERLCRDVACCTLSYLAITTFKIVPGLLIILIGQEFFILPARKCALRPVGRSGKDQTPCRTL